MATNPIIDQQQPGYLPRPKGIGEGTNLILPPTAVYTRLRHFPEEVYSLDKTTHLYRFIAALLGDAGVAQLRKRMLIARLQSTVQGTSFYDLDRFYGALFGAKRRRSEKIEVDPYTAVLTNTQWEQIQDADASFRSRVEQLARGIHFGATAIGMEVIAEALLNIDCDIYESFSQADKLSQSYGDLETFTYGQLEDFTYGGLEANAPGSNPNFNRWAFTVVPKRPITREEEQDLIRVLRQIKPANAFLQVRPLQQTAFEVVPIRRVVADSEYWEVRSRVVARQDLEVSYSNVGTVEAPAEQPRPPFSAYQGESWSYMGDIAGVMGYAEFGVGGVEADLYQRVVFGDGSYIDYLPDLGVRPVQESLMARATSDGVLVAHPYGAPRADADPAVVFDSQGRQVMSASRSLAAVSPLYVDGISLDDLADIGRGRAGLLRRQQQITQRFWATPERTKDDIRSESLEVRLRQSRRVNYATFEVPHFPMRLWFEYLSETTGKWVSVYTTTIHDSFPVNILQRADADAARMHPQHSITGHWLPIDITIPPVKATSFRVRMQRLATGTAPKDAHGNEVGYSLGVKSLEVGYRIRSRDDIPRLLPSADGEIGNSLDILGSRVSFDIRERPATNAIDGDASTAWMSEPQPVGSAVVNFYVDTRTSRGDGQIVDRWYIDPVKPGPLMNIYYSNDDAASGTFEASDRPLGFDEVYAYGNFERTTAGMAFDNGDPAYWSIDNAYLQFDPTEDWWVGMQIHTRAASPNVDIPLFSFGNIHVRLMHGAIALATPYEVVAAPIDFQAGFGAKFIVGWKKATREFYISTLSADGTISSTARASTFLITDRPTRFIIGSHPTGVPITNENLALYPSEMLFPSESSYPSDNVYPGEDVFPSESLFPGEDAPDEQYLPNIADYVLQGFVLKTGVQANAVDFFEQTYSYLVRHEYASQDSGRTNNALVRFHADLIDPSSDDHPLGLVGGPGDFYALLSWTPIPRDYTLQKGYINIPPTKAKHWKFEFSNLVAQPFEVYVPMQRRIKLFPLSAIPGATGQTRDDPSVDIPGYSSAEALYRTYQDTPINEIESVDPTTVLPTSALYAEEPSGSQRLRDLSYAYGFVPWHIGSQNPRFREIGVHRYDELTFEHNEKVAFFVGIKEISAHLVDNGALDNPEAIVDHFWDGSRLAASTFSISEGDLSSSGKPFAEATSVVYQSRNRVVGVQFASQQTDAVQLLPDAEFRDQSLSQNKWDNDDTWHVHGDATLRYQRSDQTVLISRNAVTERSVDPYDLGLVQRPLHPVFALYDGESSDEDVEGGIESGLVRVSPEGVVHAACRITAVTDLTNPLWVQIVDINGTVLEERSIQAKAGDTVEWTASYVLGSFGGDPLPQFEQRTLVQPIPHPVATEEALVDEGPGRYNPGFLFRVRCVQKGASSDAWKVDSLALFDESIAWEFSVDGGQTFFPAYGIRNNPNGILTFKDPGAQLVFRVKAFRPNMHVSSVQIRPRYEDLPTLRSRSSYRGANVSAYDQFPPIQDDPEFQRWLNPVPRWWWLEGQRYGKLPLSGYELGNEFSRGYVRYAEDDISGMTDEATRVVFFRRHDVGEIDEGHVIDPIDEADRQIDFKRSTDEDISTMSDEAWGNIISTSGLPHPIPHQIGDADESYSGQGSGDFETPQSGEGWEE